VKTRTLAAEAYSVRRSVVIIGIVLVVAGLTAGGGWYFLTPGVAVAPAALGPAVQAVYATGVVEPVHWAKVGPVVTGRLTAIDAEEGQKVTAGQALARLDDRDAKSRVAELASRLGFLKEQVRRFSHLRETGAASQQAYDQAKTDMDQTQAALEGAQKRLADMTLRSPLNGVVLRKDGEPGETVREGQILFWVGEPSPLWITADVDEDDIPLIRVGQKALIRADAFPGAALSGAVSEITPKGDPITRVYRARIALADAAGLRVGMTTEINIVVREAAQAVLVPSTAVRSGRVFVLTDGRAVARKVTIGAVGVGKAEIRAGLNAGELVLVDPPASIADGQSVRSRAVAAN
jgi:RND family efflux transporter MFP subunit